MDAFIIGKAITGFGSSGTYISVIVIITAMTSAETRGRYFGYIGFMWGLGTIIGPPVGAGFAVSAGGWRWSFYFNLILVGVTFPIFLFVLPPSEPLDSHKSLWVRVRHIDLLGSLLFAGALALGITALSFGGSLYALKSGRIIGLFCSSGVLWVAFSIQQVTASFTSKAGRILPIHILHSWEMWILIIQTGCSMSILFITIYYVPLYYQFVRGESTVRSAVDLLPFLFTSVFAMLASGRLISGFGWYKFWFVSGSSLALVMSACLYNTDLDTPRGKIYAYLVLGGIGIGLYAMNSAPIMAAIVAKEHTADASTVFGCIDTISGAISVAIANCIFVNRATDNIQRVLPNTPRAMVQDTITGVGASLIDQLSPSDRTAVLQATLDAIKDVWIQMIATAVLSLVLSFFMRNKKLSDISRG
ncbi:MAG: hypothetical protein Q9207_007511 [Kuettlingeria erythrocarpa]